GPGISPRRGRTPRWPTRRGPGGRGGTEPSAIPLGPSFVTGRTDCIGRGGPAPRRRHKGGELGIRARGLRNHRDVGAIGNGPGRVSRLADVFVAVAFYRRNGWLEVTRLFDEASATGSDVFLKETSPGQARR